MITSICTGTVKTRIKVFPLDLNANARMIGYAFLGRFPDEMYGLNALN